MSARRPAEETGLGKEIYERDIRPRVLTETTLPSMVDSGSYVVGHPSSRGGASPRPTPGRRRLGRAGRSPVVSIGGFHPGEGSVGVRQ